MFHVVQLICILLQIASFFYKADFACASDCFKKELIFICKLTYCILDCRDIMCVILIFRLN